MLSFLLAFVLTNVIFSLVLLLPLLRWDGSRHYQRTDLFLLALGLGPAITSLLLYYLFWLSPGQASGYYIGVIGGAFFLMLALNLKQLPALVSLISGMVGTAWREFLHFIRIDKAIRNVRGKEGELWARSSTWVFLLFSVLWIWWSYLLLMRPLMGHDVLEYAVQGRHLFLEKAVVYQAHHYHELSGFYYVGLHGWGYPLQQSWACLWDDAMGQGGFDLFFKAQTPWYGFLVMALVYRQLRGVDGRLANLGLLVMTMTYGWLLTTYSFHVDTFRIFLLMALLLVTMMAVKRADGFSLTAVGIFGGLAAFAHSLGVLVAGISLFTLLLFLPGKLIKERLPRLVGIGALLLLFGGIHYVMDVFYGTGWIFKSIKFY